MSVLALSELGDATPREVICEAIRDYAKLRFGVSNNVSLHCAFAAEEVAMYCYEYCGCSVASAVGEGRKCVDQMHKEWCQREEATT